MRIVPHAIHGDTLRTLHHPANLQAVRILVDRRAGVVPHHAEPQLVRRVRRHQHPLPLRRSRLGGACGYDPGCKEPSPIHSTLSLATCSQVPTQPQQSKRPRLIKGGHLDEPPGSGRGGPKGSNLSEFAPSPQWLVGPQVRFPLGHRNQGQSIRAAGTARGSGQARHA